MKSPILFSGAAALCLLAPAQSFGNVMISIQPTSQTVQGVGSLQLEISGLGNGAAPALSAFDFTLLFDPTLITPLSATFGTELGDPNLFLALTNADFSIPGEARLQEVSLITDPAALESSEPGQFVMATLTFQTEGTGMTSVDYSAVDLKDANGIPLAATAQGAIINAVPEPDILPLSALLFAVLAWRRQCCTFRNGTKSLERDWVPRNLKRPLRRVR